MASTNFSEPVQIRKDLRVVTTSPSGTSTLTTRSSLGTVNRILRSKTWVVTPNFRNLIKTGQPLPDNSFTYRDVKLTDTYGVVTIRSTSGASQTERRMTYGPCVATGVYVPGYTIDQNSVNGALIKKAKGQQWNAPIFAAEAGKTASMVIARATHLAKMVNSLRRGRFGDFVSGFHESVSPSKRPGGRAAKRYAKAYGRDARGAAGNAWLEYNYGWKPFMKDVQDAVNTLMDVVDLPASRVVVVKESRKRFGLNIIPDTRIFQDPGENVYVRGQYVQEVVESLRVAWRLSVNPSDLPARFGLTNPLEVVWELVPFSFVVDWFIPIGDYLGALDTSYRFNHLGGTVGRRTVTKMTTIASRVEASNQQWSGFTGSGTDVNVQRTKLTAAPAIGINTLKLDVNVTPVRVASAIALLGQQLSRLSR